MCTCLTVAVSSSLTYIGEQVSEGNRRSKMKEETRTPNCSSVGARTCPRETDQKGRMGVGKKEERFVDNAKFYH